MDAEPQNILSFPKPPILPWIETYQQTCLARLPSGTVAVYVSILRHFTQWSMGQTKQRELLQLNTLTSSMIERYLFDLSTQGYSFSHCKRVKSVLLNWCQWLVDDQRILSSNPVRGVKLPQPHASTSPSPRMLSPQQRAIFQNLVKQDDLRGQALFALGYWAGCRVVDLTSLLTEQTHVGSRSGWLHLGEAASKGRDIDLVNEARRPLYAYLQKRARRGQSLCLSFATKRTTHRRRFASLVSCPQTASDSRRARGDRCYQLS